MGVAIKRWTIGVIVLAFCLTSVSVVMAANPSISLILNKAKYGKAKDTITLNYDIKAGDQNNTVDFYLALQLPDKSYVYLAGDGAWSTDPVAYKSSWPVTTGKGTYFSATVPASLANGSYTFWGVFTAPGSSPAALQVIASGSATATVVDKTVPFALAKMKGAYGTRGDTEIYPDNKIAITLDGKYAYQNNNKIITTGLRNVPIGSYVYLEGKAHDEREKAITSWSWELTPPGGSTAKLMDNYDTTTYPAPKYQRFLADKAGIYQIKVIATSEDGVTSSYSFKVYAGKFVGIANCATCHNNPSLVGEEAAVYSSFISTGHAAKFENTYASYSAASPYCIRCHVTGYDETDNSGGFDEEAKKAGFDPTKDKSAIAWLKEKWATLTAFLDDPATAGIQKIMNIQCEQCHGPGANHPSEESHLTYDHYVCTQCHPQYYEFKNAAHSKEPELHMAGGTSCVECHTGQGFIQVKMRGKEAIFPADATADKPATLFEPGSQPPIACPTCHDPHSFPNTDRTDSSGRAHSYQLRVQGEVHMPAGVSVEAHDSAICVTCHANKRDVQYKADFIAGTKTRGVHGNPQADVFYGAGAYDYGKTFGNSAHTTYVKEACIECHMAGSGRPTDPGLPSISGLPRFNSQSSIYSVGGHSFAMEGKWTYVKEPEKGEVTVENVAVCNTSACHNGTITDFNRQAWSDYDKDGKVEGVQDEIDGLLAGLSGLLPKDASGAVLSSPVTTNNTTEAQRKALWNYWLITNDGSRGIHNTKFAKELLEAAIQDMSAAK